MTPPSDIHGEAKTIDKIVGQNLRTHRHLKGLSQGQLGVSLGLTFQQIQKYESGTNRISASKLIQLTEVLDVPMSAFFEGIKGEGEKELPSFDRIILRTAANLNAIRNQKTQLALMKLINALADKP